ncbi:hypothetical protein P3TCK_00300 [Photobacterium profundum 3TCK]|uniref:Uncharacterized protein n=1 Tax=Photobacterium profundum 3TCK TaxID=314280 RepID=Q1YZZ4_9GAMM|nr:hypothetical protein P3TCK_00300 [Photobacterium profundum 3TCK]
MKRRELKLLGIVITIFLFTLMIGRAA